MNRSIRRKLKLEPGLELELFKECEEKQNVRIMIMLDFLMKSVPTINRRL